MNCMHKDRQSSDKIKKVQLKKQYPRSFVNVEKLKKYLKGNDNTKDSTDRREGDKRA